MSDQDQWLLADTDDTADSTPQAAPWKVLVVDDEEEIHRVTQMVLHNFQFDQRRLQLLHAHSGQQAIATLQEHPDIALVLLDVVMEDEHAGLAAVRRIREELDNRMVRVVLRTGQPGQAPEHEVIAAYDINDYREKTELTAQKLKTLLYATLRSYRDLLVIDSNRRGLERVIQATTRIFEQRELQRFASSVLQQLTHLLQLERDAAYLQPAAGLVASQQQQSLMVEAASGRFEALISQPAEQALSPELYQQLREVLQTGKSRLDGEHYLLHYSSSSGAQSVLYVGLQRPLDEFSHELLELFCTNVSIAFENLHLNRDLEESQKEMIYLLGEAIESRSNETGSHVKRVADLSHYLALRCGLDEARAELIRIASPMHDIGKISIPDAILNKPGKHTADEWEIMKQHARLGFEMLNRSQRRVFQIAAALAHEHHEHWDGLGYPRGLAAESISIEGRITSVADVFDALLSVRCYKQPWPAEQVKQLFLDERGRKFDPQLVDIVLNEFEQLLEIRNAYPD